MKRSLLFVLLFFTILVSNSQDQRRPLNVVTPNAASLGTYGNIPVSNFTGTPNINIPLYTLKDKDIEIPLNLSYHLSSLKLNSHPGWVGLGWSLSSGGAISRVINHEADELGTSENSGEYDVYLRPGYYFSYKEHDINNWNSEEQIRYLSEHSIGGGSGSPRWDMEPDEFHFNFLGYSGTFYLNHKGEWVVKSDQNIKVVFEETNGGFIDFYHLRDGINPHGRYTHGGYQSYYFDKFTLVTGDGNRYEFGGGSAVEYSTKYRQHGFLAPTTWKLSKITTIDGNIIDFEYEGGAFTPSLFLGRSYLEYNRGGNHSFLFGNEDSCSGLSNNLYPSNDRRDGLLLFPVYLKKISSNNFIVEFTRSQTTEMRYPNPMMWGVGVVEDYTFTFRNDVSEFQWAQLDEIKIMDKNGEFNKKFELSYTNSDNTRLKLLSIKEKDSNNSIGKKYTFEYNPNNMSPYLADQTDHWGFFNNYDVSLWQAQTPLEFINDYASIRAPDPTGESYKYEILEKITYPTGGYTAFEYEPHDYSKVVSKDRELPLESFVVNQPAGGLRIKKIISNPNSDDSPIIKEYFYVNDYQYIVPEPFSFESSGILGGQPEYKWFDYEGVDLENNSYQYSLFSSNSLVSTGLNSEGSHIGYSVVWETTKGDGVVGNGIKKYTYTNFGTDIYGNTHQDELPINRIDPIRSIYSPYTSKSIERGKLTSVTDYKVVNFNLMKLKEKKYFYQKTSDDFIRSIYVKPVNVCSGNAAGAQNFYGVAYKKHVYNYNLIKKESTAFDTKGLNPLISTTEYIYNENNLLSEEKITDSKGDLLQTSYTYASDIKETWPQPSSISSYRRVIQQMDIKNMINYPIEITKNINQNISSELYNYKFYNGTNIKLFNISDLKLPPSENFTTAHFPNGITEPFIIDSKYKIGVVFHDYYPNGNIKEFSKSNGTRVVYIWGYYKNHIIAKIENATYSQVQNHVSNLQNLSNSDVDYNSENALRDALVDLREDPTLSNAQVTTYTYNPLIGVTSIADPRGYTIYYEYDNFNRLEQVKDAKGNILSKNEYHYKD